MQLTQYAPLLVQLAERQWGASATLPLSILPGALACTCSFASWAATELLSYYMWYIGLISAIEGLQDQAIQAALVSSGMLSHLSMPESIRCTQP